jgi:methylated-DNA-[protein]-cysteine S-methyltransferase
MIVLEIAKNSIIARKWRINDIEEAVYTLVQLIPIGCTTTYKDVAEVLNISPRLVAKLLSRNRNPIIIPCHRVIRSDGSLGGYTINGVKAPEIKRRLLEIESNGRPCRFRLSEYLGLYH